MHFSWQAHRFSLLRELALALLAVVTTAQIAAAQCASRREVQSTAAITAAAIQCIARHDGVAHGCEPAGVPACAGRLPDDLAALVTWPGPGEITAADVAASAPQLACQRALATTTAAFMRSRLRNVAIGRGEPRAIAAASRSFRRLDRSCRVVATRTAGGALLPSLGGACAGAGITAGAPVDLGALRRCIETQTDPWFERVLRGFLRPNVVVILTDDQPLGMLDVMPNVQALAATGVTFTHAVATTPLCAPSRASLLTGQYAHNHNVRSNDLNLGGSVLKLDDTATIATWLHARGYRTGLVGKYVNGYAALAPRVPPGWDFWRVPIPSNFYDYDLTVDGTLVHHGSAPEDYSTDVLAPLATDFILSSDDKPFFLLFAPYAPHAPANAAPRHVGAFATVPPLRPPSWNEDDVSDKPPWIRDLPLLDAATVADLDSLRRSMLESLLAVDEAVASILDALRATGQERNTVIVFASDNGYALGEHRRSGKLCPYEECFRVPMIVRYPRMGTSARTDDRIVANIDLAPTIAALAGATPTLHVDGVSLLPLFDGSATQWRDAILIEQSSFNPPAPVQAWAPPWAYIEYAGLFPFPELYDLAADPWQLQNVARDPANGAVRSALAARVRELAPAWTQPIP